MAIRCLLFLAVTTLLGGVAIRTDFEGGSLGRVEKISESHFRLGAKGERDQDGRNRQANWYFFAVEGATPAVLTLDIVDLPGEYDYQPNRGAITKDTPPVISYDGKTWTHVKDFEYDPEEPRLRLRIRPTGPRFFVAHVPPYTNATLAALRDSIRGNSLFHEEVIGRTPGGRDLLLWTIGRGGTERKKTVWLMFRQHSWESGSSWVAEGLVRALLEKGGGAWSDKVVWKVLPLCDPDGVARGGVRFNYKGFDLNRNWDVEDAENIPEITAQRNAVKRWLGAGNRIDLFLSLHNTEESEYLEGPPDAARFREMSERLFRVLSGRTSFAPTRELFYSEATTTAGKVGRMNVAQGLHANFGIAAFLMEQRISMNPKLGHLPEIADRLRFGKELASALTFYLDRISF